MILSLLGHIMSTEITVPPAPSPSENAAMPPPSKPDDPQHVPLEDFVCYPPALRFIDKRKLAQASQDVIAYQKAIASYKPTDHFAGFQPHPGIDVSTEAEVTEQPSSPTEGNTPLPTTIVEQLPSVAAPPEIQDVPEDAEFQKMLRQHEAERQNMAYDFRREQAQILNNFYDAQVRENMQYNKMIDHRPISDALRHISKRISYPVDMGVQRFYKYAFRCEKLTKRFKKSLEKLTQNHDLRAEILFQKQLQAIVAYGDIHHLDVKELKVPKVPAPVAPDVN